MYKEKKTHLINIPLNYKIVKLESELILSRKLTNWINEYILDTFCEWSIFYLSYT